MEILFANDWLGSAPCFFNEKTGAIGQRIHEVIDYRNLEFDGDALGDYLDFGYSVFGRTPVRHVRFVQPCASLVRTDEGALLEQALPDPVDRWSRQPTDPEETILALSQSVKAWEKTVTGDIVLPLSGGYDSRLLAALIEDKSRLRAYTYGISTRQDKSHEVLRAEKIAGRLGCRWQHIPLGKFHRELPAWEQEFGVSTHAHGMYHMEFYREISRQLGAGHGLLSGLIGDAWAGSIGYLSANSLHDLPALGLSHGVHAGRGQCRLRHTGRYREMFWAEHAERFQDPTCQIVERIRLKMILLRYLLILPAKNGFKPWTPFVDSQIVQRMIMIPSALRHRRQWQKNWFTQQGLMVRDSLGGSRSNSLDLSALANCAPEPLDATLLDELFPRSYIESINRSAFHPSVLSRQWAMLCSHPKIAGLNKILRAPNPHLQAYNTYLTLKPLELLLRRRNAA